MRNVAQKYLEITGGLTPDAPEAGQRMLRLSPTSPAGPGDRGRYRASLA